MKIPLQVKPKRFNLQTVSLSYKPTLQISNKPVLQVKTNRLSLMVKPKSKRFILGSITKDRAIKIINNSETYFSSSGLFSTQMLNSDSVYFRLTESMREPWIEMISENDPMINKVEVIRHFAIIHFESEITNTKRFIIFEDRMGYDYKPTIKSTEQKSDINTEGTPKSSNKPKIRKITKRTNRKKGKKS